MVAGVQEPARPVHHPAVHHIGKAFHQRDGQQKESGKAEERHGGTAYRPVRQGCEAKRMTCLFTPSQVSIAP